MKSFTDKILASRGQVERKILSQVRRKVYQQIWIKVLIEVNDTVYWRLHERVVVQTGEIWLHIYDQFN